MTDAIRRVKLQGSGKAGQYVKWETVGQMTDGILVKKVTTSGQYGPKVDLLFTGLEGAADFTVSASTAVLRDREPDMVVGRRYQIEFAGTRQVKTGTLKDFDIYEIPPDDLVDGPATEVEAEESPFTEAAR